MPRFGHNSEEQLSTCRKELVLIAWRAIEFIDFSVIEGHRSSERQLMLFRAGLSKLDGTTKQSKHASQPSRAFDLMPYPRRIHEVSVWEDPMRFHVLAGVILHCGYLEEVPLRWGGDWDGDWTAKDQQFHDLGHFELKT